MGAKIDGIGGSTLASRASMAAADHARVVPDRIVAGTWAFAAAMTRGDITVQPREAGHLEIALDKLATCGRPSSATDDGFRW